LNDVPNPFSIVATSAKVEYYKIHRSSFISNFGGMAGEQLNQIRSLMVIKNN